MRHSKIICTLGPKTESKETIEELIEAGMNVARINLSHGTAKWHAQVIKNVRQAKTNWHFPIAIMVDTQGPEIRTSGSEVGLEQGDLFKIAVSSACDVQENEKHTFINYAGLINKVKKGDTVLIDDGLIALETIDVQPHHITCKVLNKGKLGTKKSVNLPGIKVNLPSITDYDKESIKAVADQGIDFVAQSFVTKKQDILDMRAFLKSINCDADIIAKIEDQEGIDNIEEIIKAADAIMVARGDLGVELPLEEIPMIQHMLARKCHKAGKPFVIATHLLESMITNPRPTRAEVTDVANAIFQKADCIMLSAETTKGDHPIQATSTMHKIAKKTQTKLRFDYPLTNLNSKDVEESITLSACLNAENIDAKAIVVFSQTGKFSHKVSKKRPNVDIYTFTDNVQVQRKLMLHWSTFSFQVNFKQEFNAMVEQAISLLKKEKLLKSKDKIVIVSDIIPKRGIDTLEIRDID